MAGHLRIKPTARLAAGFTMHFELAGVAAVGRAALHEWACCARGAARQEGEGCASPALYAVFSYRGHSSNTEQPLLRPLQLLRFQPAFPLFFFFPSNLPW